MGALCAVPSAKDAPVPAAVLVDAGREIAVVRVSPPGPAGFSMRDRIELREWECRAAGTGICRVVLEPAEPSGLPEEREFLLLYVAGEEWARWGVARGASGVIEVWQTGDGATIGRHETLAGALESFAAL